MSSTFSTRKVNKENYGKIKCYCVYTKESLNVISFVLKMKPKHGENEHVHMLMLATRQGLRAFLLSASNLFCKKFRMRAKKYQSINVCALYVSCLGLAALEMTSRQFRASLQGELFSQWRRSPTTDSQKRVEPIPSVKTQHMCLETHLLCG